jgi:hypothetical protein
LAYEDPTAFEAREDPARSPAHLGAWMDYLQAIRSSGVLVHSGGLQAPHTATSVQLRDGDRLVQDGPYADTKEQLGGYLLVDVPDLDAALEWAARCPAASYSGVEVRPLLPRMG